MSNNQKEQQKTEWERFTPTRNFESEPKITTSKGGIIGFNKQFLEQEKPQGNYVAIFLKEINKNKFKLGLQFEKTNTGYNYTLVNDQKRKFIKSTTLHQKLGFKLPNQKHEIKKEGEIYTLEVEKQEE